MSARVPAALAPCAGFREPTSPSEVIPHHQLPESRQEPGFQHLPEHAQGDRNADTTGTGVGAARTGGSGAASPPEADRLPPLSRGRCGAAVGGAGAGAAWAATAGRGQVGWRGAGRGRVQAAERLRSGGGGGVGSPGPAIKGKGPGGGRRALRHWGERGREGGRERRSRLPQESRAGGSSSGGSRDARLPLPARRQEAGEHRGAAAASSCGSGRRCPASAGGSVEAKNKNWQKLYSVYERMKSILMTKHRNLENHRF
ncbi:spidroin-1 isoform X2 [Gallus gallus]|uniref:spidroin-1 isoform X2 n=1 Tax=Gallus gallus TaxID=9031 RepID=UPI001AE1ABA8|nr:spidroin-1 isoform X2 [Gallus gallus]